MLVGNKKDLEDKRQVPYKEGSELAEDNDILFCESSAKTGENVGKIFIDLAKQVLYKVINGDIDI